jgi:hypothetical protein
LAEGVEQTDLVTKLQSNGDVEFGELSIRDMDPEEIRVNHCFIAMNTFDVRRRCHCEFQAELKRLYTSLHALKMTTMRKDNPHLTKRQGQRRKHRRFSMQAFQRHTSAHTNSGTGGVTGAISHVFGGVADKHDHDSTKTPEDSTGDGVDRGPNSIDLNIAVRLSR